MKSKDNIINLDDFRVQKGRQVSKIFTGRDRGKYVREVSNLDKIESQYEIINIIIPSNIYAINPSFFEELFLNVVTKLGKENFLKKFTFTTEGNYDYTLTLHDAIDRIMRKKNALG